MSNFFTNLFNNSNDISNETTWKFFKSLWEQAESRKDEINKAKRYYDGNIDAAIDNQNKRDDNIIHPICELKISNMLDAQFEIAVLPKIAAFSNMNSLKDNQEIADILNEEIKNVEKNQNIEEIDEQVCRDGELYGFGVTQTIWNKQTKKIEIKRINPKNLRWIKNVLIAYKITMSVYEVKNKYAKNIDGSYNKELCQIIDDLAEVTIGNNERKYSNQVINYIDEENDIAGQSFASRYGTSGVEAGKQIELIVMYLLDSSCYSPDENDDNEQQQMKEEYIRCFPNGRKIIFNESNDKKIILCDEPLDENFKNLGNIDVYNPIITDSFEGLSPLKVIFQFQDRIDGLYTKYRNKIQWDIDTRLIDSNFGVSENALVLSPLTRVDNFNQRTAAISEPLSNDGIAKAVQVLNIIEKLKSFAYEKAGVNETMLAGYRQSGTTSAEQVEALQESPLVKIRRQQRNFINYKIKRAEKILMLIMKNYSSENYISISNNLLGINAARFNKNEDKSQSLQLISEVNNIVQVIKEIAINEKFKFNVECTAGTGIPRTRKEIAQLNDQIAQNSIMNSGDLDLIELYLTAQDYPQKRALMSLLRQKQQQALIPVNKTSAMQKSLLSQQGSVTLKNLMEACTGFVKAQQAILRMYGLIAEADTLSDAPIQGITSRSPVKDIAAIVPQQVGRENEQMLFGNSEANRLEQK